MIIACPACATRYAVPDSAIGVEGRIVRCAKCRHSWFQDGPEVNYPQPSDQEPAPVAPAPVEAAPAPAEAPEAPPAPAFATAQDFAQSPSSFEHQPPFRPRRNPARLWTMLAVGFAVVTVGAMGAVVSRDARGAAARRLRRCRVAVRLGRRL